MNALEKGSPAPGKGREQVRLSEESNTDVFTLPNINLAFNGRKLHKDSRLRRKTESLICNLIANRGGQSFDEIYEYIKQSFPSLERYVLNSLANLCHSGNGQRRRLTDTVVEGGYRIYYIDELSSEWLE